MYVKEAFDTNWIAPLGTNVNEFEKEFTAMVGCQDAAALSSGTAAIHLALKAAGVKEGDVVFCPTLTFSATVNPIAYEKAIPVFIDSDYETWNMSPAALRKAFLKYPHVKAVIVVHLYGMCADMDEIKRICEEYHVPIIEDAAEALGSTYRGKWAGTFGDYGIFSFNGNKIITTSGGGMLVCNMEDEGRAKEKAQKVRFWSTQSRDQARHYQHSEVGYNYRMSNVVAGIGRGQLRVLKDRVEKKRYIYQYYKDALKDIDGISFMPMIEGTYCNCWLTCIQIDPSKTAVTPNVLMDALDAENIESRPVWKPMHMQPIFAECDYVDHGGVSQALFEHGVCLPSDSKMTDEELDRVIELIRNVWNV